MPLNKSDGMLPLSPPQPLNVLENILAAVPVMVPEYKLFGRVFKPLQPLNVPENIPVAAGPLSVPNIFSGIAPVNPLQLENIEPNIFDAGTRVPEYSRLGSAVNLLHPLKVFWNIFDAAVPLSVPNKSSGIVPVNLLQP